MARYITIIFPDESLTPPWWHKWHNIVYSDTELRRLDHYIKWKYPGVKYYNMYEKKKYGQAKAPYLGRRYLN